MAGDRHRRIGRRGTGPRRMPLAALMLALAACGDQAVDDAIEAFEDTPALRKMVIEQEVDIVRVETRW